jgi:hypothetical protein
LEVLSGESVSTEVVYEEVDVPFLIGMLDNPKRIAYSTKRAIKMPPAMRKLPCQIELQVAEDIKESLKRMQ